MSELDFRKQLIINELKTLAKGKKGDELLPLVLAISNKANSMGIKFTQEDFSLIIDQIKDNLTPEEQKMLPELLKMLGYSKKH